MMAYRLSATRRPIISRIATALIALAFAARAVAIPVFYITSQSSGATPGFFFPISLAPGSTGTLHLWVNSDIRLSGISLDLVELGGAIKFTGVEVVNPSGSTPRWSFLDGPQTVTDSAIEHIGGAAIPGVHGDGVGAGSRSGTNVRLASVDYMVTTGHAFALSLRVGGNGIADFGGNFVQLRFGSNTAPLISGDQFGASGFVGGVGIPSPPSIVDVNLGNQLPGSIISHSYRIPVGIPPVTFTDVEISGPGAPAIAPTLSSNGMFNWNSSGSPLGRYNFDITATNAIGSDVSRLTVNLVPEPAGSMHALAVAAICGSPVFGRNSRFVRDKRSASQPINPGPAGSIKSAGQGALNLHGIH